MLLSKTVVLKSVSSVLSKIALTYVIPLLRKESSLPKAIAARAASEASRASPTSTPSTEKLLPSGNISVAEIPSALLSYP
jgi:hypothetical protein